MGKQYRRYKASGVVKFSDNQVLGEDLEEAKRTVHGDLIDSLISANYHGTLDLVELSELEDLGLSGLEID